MLQAELAHAMEQLKGEGADHIEWRDALAAKDLEIQNLQVMIIIRLRETCLGVPALPGDAVMSFHVCEQQSLLLAHQLRGIRAAQHLQAALGELAYKSETAERLRTDLRAQVARTREAEGRCDSARQEVETLNDAQQALRSELEAARQQLERQRRLEERLSVCYPHAIICIQVAPASVVSQQCMQTLCKTGHRTTCT